MISFLLSIALSVDIYYIISIDRSCLWRNNNWI